MPPKISVTEETSRRVVITGIGLITPYAVGREQSWQKLLSGHSATRLLQDLSNQLGRPIAGGIIPDAELSSTSHTRTPFQMDPSIDLTLKATSEAIEDAGLDRRQLSSESAGCVIGSSKGGIAGYAELTAASHNKSTANDSIPPEFWLQCLPTACSQAVTAEYGLQGAALTPVSACATGLSSVMRGADLIRDGICDTVIAGSADASLVPAVLGSFQRMGVLATDFPSSAQACKPYDSRRNGFVVGEGAGIMILESLEHALERNATPYAEWLGGGLGADSTHLMQFDPAAESLARLIKDTLQRAHVSAAELDYINLHGTGTQINDLYETRALQNALGDLASSIPCSSLKGGMGHLLGAAGSVELGFTILAMRDHIIPATLNLEHPDPQCNLNYTPRVAVPKTIRTALKLSFGFGGHLVAGLLRNWQVTR
ncbi:beta-ketoacyl-[acyl-carrier-protein] synthase family protein [Gimesia algae]|uniref:3-oxoacyl-[acyl-carrier-protein] synthase 2 n=1 Tax=Gimesia algae TaxID=2527971 RepID=A0A517V8M3_9PLAN|nr:beta-ketoacyl-[acyl-carrier-protein] synthase family protein [Gimesia algae]QDT89350.1 3-oxoacyl-[acyl-carrier-protein] synthase 2 [Gimesia algae]